MKRLAQDRGARLAPAALVLLALATACGAGHPSGKGSAGTGSTATVSTQATVQTQAPPGKAPRSSSSSPAAFKGTSASLARLTEEVLGSQVGSLKRGRIALCFEGACELQYNVGALSGADPERTLIEEPRQIWKALFRYPELVQTIMVAWGDIKGSTGKAEEVPLVKVSCDRAEVGGIDWDTVTAAGIEKACTVTPEVQF